MYKIVALDLDGTLLDSKKNILPRTKAALDAAKKMGVKIVIATGRPFSGVYPVLEELNLTSSEDFVIIYNGAKVFNVGTKEIIFSSDINGTDVRSIYHESKRLGVFCHAFRQNEELITVAHNPYTDVEARINHITDHPFNFDEINDSDLFLKCMMVDSDENITRVMKEINPVFPEKYSMVRSSKIFLEFLKKGTNKGEALVALANYLNLPMNDVIAMGDAGNDISMITAAGLGIAMENAFPEVKEKADYVTENNNDDGVGKAVEKFILNR